MAYVLWIYYWKCFWVPIVFYYAFHFLKFDSHNSKIHFIKLGLISHHLKFPSPNFTSLLMTKTLLNFFGWFYIGRTNCNQKLHGMNIIIQLKVQNHRNTFGKISATVLHGLLFQMFQKHRGELRDSIYCSLEIWS